MHGTGGAEARHAEAPASVAGSVAFADNVAENVGSLTTVRNWPPEFVFPVATTFLPIRIWKIGTSSVCPAADRISTQKAECVAVPVQTVDAAASGICVPPDRYVPAASRAWSVPESGSVAPPRSAAAVLASTVPIVWPALPRL